MGCEQSLWKCWYMLVKDLHDFEMIYEETAVPHI